MVVAVNGAAAGAGMSLALSGDLVLAGSSARFLQSFARLGLIPDMGSTWLLPRLVGRQRAMSLAMLAEPLEAEKALKWGLIHAVHEDNALAGAAMELAQKLASGPTKAYGLLKIAMRNAEQASFDDQLALERDLQREAGRTDDFMEAVSAFVTKRKPDYKGSDVHLNCELTEDLPMKFIFQLSDPHVSTPGSLVFDRLKTNDNLSFAIEYINNFHVKPELVIITGNLVEDGREEEYRLLTNILDKCKYPVRVIPGSHDKRAPPARKCPTICAQVSWIPFFSWIRKCPVSALFCWIL